MWAINVPNGISGEGTSSSSPFAKLSCVSSSKSWTSKYPFVNTSKTGPIRKTISIIEVWLAGAYERSYYLNLTGFWTDFVSTSEFKTNIRKRLIFNFRALNWSWNDSKTNIAISKVRIILNYVFTFLLILLLYFIDFEISITRLIDC